MNVAQARAVRIEADETTLEGDLTVGEGRAIVVFRARQRQQPAQLRMTAAGIAESLAMPLLPGRTPEERVQVIAALRTRGTSTSPPSSPRPVSGRS